MNKFMKILAVIVGIFAALFIGVVAFVHFYLTDERIRTLIIPPAEKALGRSVAIGSISVSIFSGITVNDFVIKEQDDKQDFVKVSKFVLQYDLFPLLQKKLLISQVGIIEPEVRIARNKKGAFNFESLAMLTKEKPAADKPQEKPTAGAAALPLALTVQEIRVEKAGINITDETGAIPATSVTANTNISMDLGADSTLTYKGDMDAGIKTTYGKLKPKARITSNFDQSDLDYTADIDIEDQQVKLSGSVKNYAKTPDILLNVASEILDLDKLAALASQLPKSPEADNKKSKSSQSPKSSTQKAGGEPPPPVHGKVTIKRALYDTLTIDNFALAYALKNNVLTVSDLAAETAGGKLGGAATVDLNKPDLAYQGKLAVGSLQLTPVLNIAAPKVAKTVSGVLSLDMNFNGQGTKWEKLRDRLNAEGNVKIQDGRLQNTPMTEAIAQLLDLKEINNLTFKEAGGNFEIKNGEARLASQVSGTDVSVDGDGIIGLDGRLDFPMTLHFSPKLSAKLSKRASFTKYLMDEKGETVLHLKVAGTVQSPKPTIDTAGLKKQAEQQIKKEVKKKARSEVERAIKKEITKNKDLAPLEETTKGLLDNIFGK